MSGSPFQKLALVKKREAERAAALSSATDWSMSSSASAVTAPMKDKFAVAIAAYARAQLDAVEQLSDVVSLTRRLSIVDMFTEEVAAAQLRAAEFRFKDESAEDLLDLLLMSELDNGEDYCLVVNAVSKLDSSCQMKALYAALHAGVARMQPKSAATLRRCMHAVANYANSEDGLLTKSPEVVAAAFVFVYVACVADTIGCLCMFSFFVLCFFKHAATAKKPGSSWLNLADVTDQTNTTGTDL